MRFTSNAAATTAALALLASPLVEAASAAHQQPLAHASTSNLNETTLVPVRIGLMSRCPDFFYFAAQFSHTMSRVAPLMELHYSFIADVASGNNVSCKHGALECAGNKHELCVAKAAKRMHESHADAQRATWDFVECLNFEGGLRRIGEESLVKQCLAATRGPRWEEDGVKECVEGKEGEQLLRESALSAKKHGIEKSATLQIEDHTVCVRDDNQWKECEGGHDPLDWTRAIERAYAARNPKLQVQQEQQAASSHVLHKRQAPSGTTTGAPAATSSGTFGTSPPANFDNNQRTTPLSVFTFVIEQAVSWRLAKRQVFTNDSVSGSNVDINAAIYASVVAIALFVLVVAFVLLRIFVRNRRLRRLGLLPDGTGPMDRYFGGAAAPQEDSLVPPKLWEAKIVDVRAAVNGSRAEKSALGGGIGAGDVKTHGWDALMPVSAALPPNLYSLVATNKDGSGKNNGAVPPSYPPHGNRAAPQSRHAGALTRHLPGFMRRTSVVQEESAPSALPDATAPADAAATPAAAAAPTSNADEASPIIDERIPASVNITVLIAMPSPQTVFPSTKRRLHGSASQSAFLSLTATSATLDEEDEDAGLAKGKTRANRAPSIRTIASHKSVAEARREAYFGESGGVTADEVDAQVSSPAAVDEEEEELPELVFGTASVPLFTRDAALSPAMPLRATNLNGSYLRTPASELVHPSKTEIVALVASAREAHERKEKHDAAAAQQTAEAEAAKKAEEASIATPDGNSGTPRVNVVATSSTAPALDGVVTHRSSMAPSTLAGDASMRPSASLDVGRSYDRSATPRTMDPLLDEDQSRLSMQDRNDADIGAALTAMDHPLAVSSGEAQPRASTSTWHTGVTGGGRSQAPATEPSTEDEDDGLAPSRRSRSSFRVPAPAY